jgi:hypothetical protein
MNNSIGHLTEADITRLAESAIRSLFQTLAGEFRRDHPVAYEWLLRRRSRLNDWIANAIRTEMEIETGRRLDRVPPAATKNADSPVAGTVLVCSSHQHRHQ